MELKCPHGGDETDCESCVYYPEYEWDEEKQECIQYYYEDKFEYRIFEEVPNET